MSWVYKDILFLSTPCGDVVVTDDEGRCLPFSIRKNPYCPDYHLFYGTEKERTYNTDTNYCVCISTQDLMIGQSYKIRLVGCQLNFGDSDEHTEAVSGSRRGHSIAIGAYDPNDDEKIKQGYTYTRKKWGNINAIFAPPQYDESRFVQYDVEMLNDYSVFSFHLIDTSLTEIEFKVAWIKHQVEYAAEYEAAVEFWTT